MQSGNFIEHIACKKCGSSDGVGLYDNGQTHCFVCNVHTFPDEENINVERGKETISSDNNASGNVDTPNSKYGLTPTTTVFRAVNHRKISLEAAKKYGIDVVLNDEKIEARYPYYIGDKHVANKIRTKDKKFFWEYESKDNVNKVELYGQHLFPPASAKAITVVEGEYDAPCAWDLLGCRFPVVSVASCGTALRDIKNNYEYLNSFSRINLCLDGDTIGYETAKKIAAEFKPGKCHIMRLTEAKDPNAYLVAGFKDKFIDEWYKAPAFMPDGLKIGSEMWDEIINRPKHFQVDYPFVGLNRLTYGLRLSEMVVVTAETGIGKTSVLKEVEYALLMNPELKERDYGVGFIHLEEPNYDTALGLMSIHADKPFHLPDTERTNDELKSAYDACINSHRVVIWDHFGSNTVDAVLDKIRHMSALGCKYIVLDHLSIVVSDQSGDERKQLDEIATKAKTLCMELNLSLICVIHQNRQGQIRGTAGVEQLANIVIKLYRENTDLDEWRRNVTKVMVEKNRFCGRTGPACYLWYNGVTGRLQELTPEEVADYESGASPSDDKASFA